MTQPEKRPQPARSGWCSTRDHERCKWSVCHCSCHYGTPNGDEG